MERQKPAIDDIAFANPFGELATSLDPYCEGAKHGVMATLISAFSAYIGHEVKMKTGRGQSNLSVWFILMGISGIGRKGATARISMPVVEKAWRDWTKLNSIDGVPATGLGMTSALEESGGNLFVLEEEMDAFIRAARSDTKVGVYLRKIWDGATVTHKTSKSAIELKNPHIGFVGHVQPKNWGAISGSKDATGGTYNRFMALYVEKSKTVPMFNGPDPTKAIAEAADMLKMFGEHAQDVRTVTVPDDVADYYEEYHRPLTEQMTDGNEPLSEMCERAVPYLARLAALYALADLRDEISVADLDSAFELVRYGIESVRYVLPEMGGRSLEGRIYDFLMCRWDEDREVYLPASRSQLRDHIGRYVPVADIEEALKGLPQVIEFEKKTKGRPKMMSVINTGQTEEELEEVATWV